MMRNSCTVPAFSLWAAIFLLLIPEDFCEKIIGGRDVKPHSRPYMVLLKRNKRICAGALIEKEWVLTAAHCNKMKYVILGVHSIKNTKKENQQIIQIKKMFPYSRYDGKTLENDIQLVQLRKRATINENVTTLPLPSLTKNGNDVKPNTQCQVAGWGKISNEGSSSDTLKEVSVTIIDRKICSNKDHYNNDPVIGRNMICAGNRKGGKDSCEGDSGSPLICKGELRGITSHGAKGKCGDPRFPGIYTLLSQKHIDWINTTMERSV
ncbi:granzyme A-like isoform X1 [Talpa occidentalis]|uniref:granzyme A-like isoform X1 n=1 Tax=Talpa occidentalis TaxID=50954 RepID=UPI0023F7B4D4|nr:granzyme A-like isoform X1 [Talpa occidentalis]